MTGTELASSPGSLPRPTTRFVGRRQELSQARTLLAASRLLTLVGPPGVGKSRLALHLAESVRSGYRDGVYLVELAHLNDPELLTVTVVNAIGLRSEVDSPADQLADKHLLLVVDNCEHLSDACAELLRKILAKAPNVKALATSRRRLGIEGEQLLSVPPLPVPDSPRAAMAGDALALFADRAAGGGFAVTSQNADTAISICRHLDGIPLAIELAATWLRGLTPGEILSRVADRIELLTLGSDMPVAHHHTLQSAIDWSYALCSPLERRLWARLSVFSGPFTLTAAEQVCSDAELPEAEVVWLVADLVEKSVLVRRDVRDQSRYFLLLTLRAYGQARLEEAGTHRVFRERHRDYYRAMANQFDAEWFSPRQLTLLRLLHQERPDLRAALDFCLADPASGPIALEIASVTIFWIATNTLREGIGWLDRALAANPGPTPQRAKALWVRSQLMAMAGQGQKIVAALAECRALAEKLNLAYFRPQIAQTEGMAAFTQGGLDAAVFDQAVADNLALGEDGNAYLALLPWCFLTLRTDTSEFDRVSQQFVDGCTDHGAEWSRAYGLWFRAVYRCQTNDPDLGRRLIHEAMRVAGQVPDRTLFVLCAEVLAWCETELGDYERAARLQGYASVLWRHSGSLAYMAFPKAVHDKIEGRLRAALAGGYNRAHRQGADMSPAQAQDFALLSKTKRARGSGQQANALTERELEIAELVALGMSNKQIATRLAIARRTVEAHVERILTKLEFTSRTQIAAWIVQRRH